MRVIHLDRDVPEVWTIGPAVEAVNKGELIVLPTDSIYAIGCDPWNVAAVNKLYAAKQLDKSKQCSVLCADLKQVGSVARAVTNDAFKFMRRHLPGAYTLILKASRDLPTQATGKRKAIGVRLPDHAVSVAVVEDLGRPLLVTSVPGWVEGEWVDPVAISERLMVRPAVVLDQGPILAEASTVIDFTEDVPEVIREGKGPLDDWLAG
ncbi:MAG: threonylcarbamoyl-AMP synthase [Deltaproteobacteria bacterium]|nr:MAG: threonylcarbamoyl-AMP synthase [Deltaproteobacteria bacterium]